MIYIRKLVPILVLAAFFGINTASMADECPPVSAVQFAVSKTFKKDIKVMAVTPGPVAGICEAQVKLQGQQRLLYLDNKGEVLIAGNIYRVSDGTNLTRDKIMELNRFSEAEYKHLESLTAFTVGTKGKTFYFVSDPDCGYCKRAESILTPMAEAGEIRLKVLLFPLPFHKGAKEKSISIICDNKGMEGLRSGYRSENQCEEGKKKIEQTIAYLRQKGISSTPTYIFDDGRFRSGVMQAPALRKRLGIGQSDSAGRTAK